MDFLTKAVKEGKIRDGTTSTGTPSFWRESRHVKKPQKQGANIVYSPDGDQTPNLLNRDYFNVLNKKYSVR
jgi:hypothetical protein